jgi:SAM-dependent methyltransferase
MPKHDRNCPVCGSRHKKPLYRQKFSGLSSQSLLDGYTVSVCADCGFGFADGLPDQEAFDAYYRDMSKYEQQHRSEDGESDRVRCQSTADVIDRILGDRSSRILDIGCATGRILGLLRQKGYAQVLGVDPSAECARVAKELYGVEVRNHTIATLPEWKDGFDAVLLVSVVEHVQTLHPLVERLATLVDEGGLLLLEHPDVTRFTPAAGGPFQEFSTEHINFFSRNSLNNLVRQHGFAEIHSFQEDRQAARNVMVPSATSLFRKEPPAGPLLVRDETTERSLSAYIRKSQQLEDGIRQKIVELIDGGIRFVVWGVGTHTQHLMETTPLREASVAAFVDSNPRYQGKKLNGVPIIAPQALRGMTEPILVSSMIFQEEIAREIRETLGIDNRIIRLY